MTDGEEVAQADYAARVPAPSQLSRHYLTMVVATTSLIVLTCVAFLVPVPYVTFKPGPVFNTLGTFDNRQMFTFGKGVTTYPTSGTLDFTTVSVSRPGARVTLFDAMKGYFRSDVAVIPRSSVYPDDETDQQSTAESAAQLDGSKDSSRVAALRAAGFTVTERVRVAGVVRGGAADKILKTGDVVLAVDGAAVRTPEQAVKAVSVVKPGDAVHLSVERKGSTKQFSIVTKADSKDPTVPRIGVSLGTAYDYPFTVNNNVGREVGGPSAGTMFALAIYDKLTPGELTGGKRIAGTGEIAADGTVGPIGGIRQKMAGAAADDVSIFLVPAANCSEASDGSDHGLRLVKITNLSDAISSLTTLAKDPTARVPSCS